MDLGLGRTCHVSPSSGCAMDIGYDSRHRLTSSGITIARLIVAGDFSDAVAACTTNPKLCTSGRDIIKPYMYSYVGTLSSPERSPMLISSSTA